MRRFALPVLAGTLLLGAVVFGTAQLAETRKLQANLAGMEQERTELRKRIWELQKLNGDLAARLDRGSTTAAPEAPAESSANPDNDTAAARPRFDANRVANLISTPEMQQFMVLQQKAGLDGGYATLFRKLNLSPADLEKFKNLLVEKQSALLDVMLAARSQGLGGRENRDELRHLVQNAQTEVDDNIRTTLGEAVYSQYKSYEATLPQRGVVNQLEKRLSYSPTPLSETQAEQLVQILANNTPPAGNSGNRADNTMLLGQATTGNPRTAQIAGMLGGSGGARITDAAVTQAHGVLTPAQVAALQSLQAEQEAAARLSRQMRNRTRTPPSNNTPPPVQPEGPGG